MQAHRPASADPLRLLLLLLGLGLGSPVAAAVPARQPIDAVRGRDLYQDLCWQCHGPAGQGDGPLADMLPTPPPSLRELAPVAWPALVDLIRAGRGDMPAYAATLDLHDTRRILVWLAALDKGDSSLLPTRPSGPAEAEETPDLDETAQSPGAAAARELKPSP